MRKMCYNPIKSGVRLVGEKDLTEKQLFELEDVFADIVNVLLLDGKTLNIPPKLEPYVSDYKINVFEVAWLSDETISKFKFEFYP